MFGLMRKLRAKQLETSMRAYPLSQLVNNPKIKSRNKLDHLYINEEQLVPEVKECEHTFGISTDYFPIIINKPLVEEEDTTETVTYRPIQSEILNTRSNQCNLSLPMNSTN